MKQFFELIEKGDSERTAGGHWHVSRAALSVYSKTVFCTSAHASVRTWTGKLLGGARAATAAIVFLITL